ncbi:MAG: hypothetical protein HUU26_05405 [Gemmatimonadaceae bacterium]|nr:hypothetical protein [Gemmatimonadaceae bacterium]
MSLFRSSGPNFLEQHMTCSPASRVLPVLTLFTLALVATEAQAQTCRGMPRGGGIAFVRGERFGGTTNGVALSKGAFALGFNSLGETQDVTAWDANLRFTLAMGGKFQVCPALGFDYMNEDWDMGGGMSLKSRIGTAQAGVGFGYEHEFMDGLSVMPFLAVDYQFTAIVFSLDTPDSGEDELSGDTLSHFNVRYGGLVRYKSFFVGIAADRYSDTEGSRPHAARFYGGFAFGAGGGSSARKAPVPRPSAIKASTRR